ncbi:MAG: hypothetical protein I8H71_05580 [Xanthomonadaceae bacterium]|nr:hypothetical protein [Xanthomonadaceae bacterium]
MPALVPELVNMASDPAVSTADLLRRALVVARRLAVPGLVGWLSQEMNGYEDRESIPEYRTMWGQLQVLEPVTGAHIPFLIQNAEKDELVRCHREGQPISVLESIAAGEGEIVKFYPTAIEQKLMDSMRVRMRPRLVFSGAQVRGIVDGARNKILEWALDLEGRGIVGEGMSFTPQEKQTVQQQHYHISNVSGSQIQISSNGSTQTQANTAGADIEGLKGLIEALGTALEHVQGDVADELRAELATLKAQADSPKPKWEIIKATARSIASVAEGAAGGLIAGLAQPHMATLLALAAF